MVYPNDDYESWALVIGKHFPRVRFGHILFLYVASRLLNHRPEYYRMYDTQCQVSKKVICFTSLFGQYGHLSENS